MLQNLWHRAKYLFDRSDVIEAYSKKSWLQGTFDRGYSPSQLDRIQNDWRIEFPPDLIVAYQNGRYLSDYDFDWLKTDPDEIRAMLDWPLKGLWFDVAENDYWWPEWGDRPDDMADREALFTEVTANAPALIPLGGHRYLPETPKEVGNPVFSVWQSDIIYYWSNLVDWIARETNGWGDGPTVTRKIPFWSEAAARA